MLTRTNSTVQQASKVASSCTSALLSFMITRLAVKHQRFFLTLKNCPHFKIRIQYEIVTEKFCLYADHNFRLFYRITHSCHYSDTQISIQNIFDLADICDIWLWISFSTTLSLSSKCKNAKIGPLIRKLSPRKPDPSLSVSMGNQPCPSMERAIAKWHNLGATLYNAFTMH